MVCIFCKSPLHDYRSCIVLYRMQKQREIAPTLKQDFFGKAPNVFIGRHGYPHVRVGILSAEEYTKNDDPLAWSKEGTSIPDIIALRSMLVNSHFLSAVKGKGSNFSPVAKEVSLAKRPVDMEIRLEKAPHPRLSFNNDVAPHGPNVPLRAASITENSPVDTRVDKIASADDLTAGDAIAALAGKGFDEHFLTRAFSMGNFGLPLERKLVPTRWSITAVDDIRGKQLLSDIRRYPESDCVAYVGGHLGNHYIIVFLDSVWQYELFEQFVPRQIGRQTAMRITTTRPIAVETDYEPFEGRHEYVQETAGGYYAARIGILEHLAARRRQSSVLAIRIITEEYTAPLGVWVVREAVRKSLSTEPVRFPDRDTAIGYAKKVALERFGYDIEPILRRSKLVKNLWGQKRLSEYR